MPPKKPGRSSVCFSGGVVPGLGGFSGEPPAHVVNRDQRPVDHRFGTFREGLVIADKPGVQDKLAERALHHPTARKYRESFLILRFADTFEGDAVFGGVFEEPGLVPAVDPAGGDRWVVFG